MVDPHKLYHWTRQFGFMKNDRTISNLARIGAFHTLFLGFGCHRRGRR